MSKRYLVEIETKPGVLTNVYHGNDRAEAARIGNFWDERVPTYLTDFKDLTPLERANREFDTAIQKLRADSEADSAVQTFDRMEYLHYE